ncbi:eukaryotic membrane protein, putative [Babesia bigemina]|uniref:Eukaryotic membrane protein, putative n=1 Tax=Babesia bigemina TaxID=5866 RepID=A0A061D451_BABBI|nr:eukaryotic membrane protein, putative [Babesia bigemina]CDR95348.1 eukaryotic membrane protein, putative [Babesia bigemina]|eukprot:XP_012767534.1 eukaryotic membrane protein, putative [Babesia bigemina]
MTKFWLSLADFVCMEIQGFPFTYKDYTTVSEDEGIDTTVAADKTVNRPSPNTDTFEETIVDPLHSIPQNSLRQMLKLPKYVEQIMWYSFSVCVDALLFELTLMPVQAVGTIMYVSQRWMMWLTTFYKKDLTDLSVSESGDTAPLDKKFMGSCDCTGGYGDPTASCRYRPKRWNTKGGFGDLCRMQCADITDSIVNDNMETDILRCVDGTEKQASDQKSQTEADVLPENNYLRNAYEILYGCFKNCKRGASSLFKVKKVTTMDDTNLLSNKDVLLINPNEACGAARFMALVMAVIILSRIDTSRVYHNIRGQPFFKLYVIFNMLEICERLCRSFGRDCTDNLMRAAIKLYKTSTNFDSRITAILNVEQLQKKTDDLKQNTNGQSFASAVITNASTRFGSQMGISYNDETEQPTHNSVVSCELRTHESKMEAHGTVPPSSPIHFGRVAQTRELIEPVACKTTGVISSPHPDAKLTKNWHHYPNELLEPSMDTLPDSVTHDASKDRQQWRSLLMEFSMCYLLVIVYIMFHTFMHLVRMLSLNIAINSSDSAMFLLMVTNNFAEIKSTVFKKYNEVSLFTIVATDSVERFHLCFDAMMVFFKMSTVRSPVNSYFTVSRWLTKMFVLEVLIDYFKHGFLLKFNRINGQIFKRYTEVLMGDVVLSRCWRIKQQLVNFNFRVTCKGTYSFSHIPSRRLGFMPSPIVTLIVCNIPYIRNMLTFWRFLGAVFIWLTLFFAKIVSSILLVAHGIRKRKNLLRLKSPMDKIGAL